jgi:hypothetical protein
MNEIEQNNIILKIKENFPNEKILIKKYKRSGKLELCFKDKNSIIPILKEYTWDEIKYNITFNLNKPNIPSNIITDMQNYAIRSEELYKICLNEGCEGIIDPTTWLFDQDSMRYTWEKYIEEFENKPDIIKDMMLNNSYSKYMLFMYDTYPPEFGNKLKECHQKKIDCNGAYIFWKLKYSSNI